MTREEYEQKYGVPPPVSKPGELVRPPQQVRPQQENIAGNILKAVVTDPINTLLVTPADRFAETVGRTGILGKNIQQGYEQMANEGQARSYLGMKVDQQKAFGQGATGQITGQALKAGSYLAGGILAPKVVQPVASTFLQGALRGATQGAIAGGTTGLLGGAGESLYKGGTLGDAALQGTIGGIAGGVSGGVLGGVIGGTAGKLNGISQRRQELKALIESGDNAGEQFAKIKLADGQVVADPKGIQAIQSGIDKSNVAVIKAMSAEDKITARKMLELAQKAAKDKTVIDRPADLVGETLLKPVRQLESLNKGFGKQLDVVAQSLAGKPVSAQPALDDFMAKLSNAGVQLADDGKFNFTGSELRTNPKAMSLIQKAYNEVLNTADDGLAIHRTKRALDELVNFEKTGEGALGNAERLVKDLRRSVDGVLDTNFADYNKVNTDYAMTRKALDEVADIMGTKFNLDDGTFANIKAGSIMRRVLGEGAGRSDILKTIQAIEDIAKAYNIPVKESAVKQIIFADTLTDVYGTQATTGLRGAVEKAIGRAQGGDVNFKQMGVEAVKGLLNNVTGKTTKGQEQAILGLLDDTIVDTVKANPLTNVTKQLAKEAYGLGAPQVVQDTSGGILGNVIGTDVK